MSDVPHLRFKEFQGKWEKYELGDICETITDFVAAGSFASLRKNVKYYQEDNYAQLVRTVDLKKKFTNNDFVYVDEFAYDFLWRVQLKEPNIVLPNIGANIGEKYYVSPKDLPKEKNVLGPNAILLRSKCNDTHFVYFRLSTSSYDNEMKKLVGASGQPKFNKTDLKKVRLFIPSLKEQKKISYFLGLLEERIATQNKIIEKMESLIKGLSQRLLSTKQGWTSYKLDELCQIKSGYSGIQVSFQTAYKVSRIETISNHCINMSRIGFVKEIPQEYKLSVGDILFSNINSVQYIGNTAFIDKDYGLYHGMNLLRIVPDSRIVFPRFIHLLLCSERLLRHFQSICNKAVSQASINQTSLGKTIMTIPSYKEQQHICSIIESVERKLDIETSLLKMLQYQKQYLLRQMFI